MRQTKSALKWIVRILNKHKVPFQITGGLAAEIYGSKRKLADIDIEIPENKFKAILKDVRRHIIFGPKRLKDKNWDMFLLTLRYGGQDIDLSGAYSTVIFDKTSKKWTLEDSSFGKSRNKKVFGITVHVTAKKNLIEYKSELGRRVDKIDLRQISKPRQGRS